MDIIMSQRVGFADSHLIDDYLTCMPTDVSNALRQFRTSNQNKTLNNDDIANAVDEMLNSIIE